MKDETPKFSDRLLFAAFAAVALFRYLLTSNGLQVFIGLEMRRSQGLWQEGRSQLDEMMQGVYDWFTSQKNCRTGNAQTQAYSDGQKHARYMTTALGLGRDQSLLAMVVDFLREHGRVYDDSASERFDKHRDFTHLLNESGFSAKTLAGGGSAYQCSVGSVTVSVSDSDMNTDFYNVGHDLVADRRDNYSDCEAIISVFISGTEVPELRCKITATNDGSLAQAVKVASALSLQSSDVLLGMAKRV